MSCGSELDSTNFDLGAAAIAGATAPKMMQATAKSQDPVKSLRFLLTMILSLPRDVAMSVKYRRDAPG